jgi:hypothetical protein
VLSAAFLSVNGLAFRVYNVFVRLVSHTLLQALVCALASVAKNVYDCEGLVLLIYFFGGVLL